MKRLSLVFVALFTLAACSGPSIDGNLYLESKPDFQLERFFEGEIKAYVFGPGVWFDGSILKRFDSFFHC